MDYQKEIEKFEKQQRDIRSQIELIDVQRQNGIKQVLILQGKIEAYKELLKETKEKK